MKVVGRNPIPVATGIHALPHYVYKSPLFWSVQNHVQLNILFIHSHSDFFGLYGHIIFGFENVRYVFEMGNEIDKTVSEHFYSLF